MNKLIWYMIGVTLLAAIVAIAQEIQKPTVQVRTNEGLVNIRVVASPGDPILSSDSDFSKRKDAYTVHYNNVTGIATWLDSSYSPSALITEEHTDMVLLTATYAEINKASKVADGVFWAWDEDNDVMLKNLAEEDIIVTPAP